MAQFRVETAYDSDEARFYAELFYPNDAPTPYARTQAIFKTHEEAAQFAIDAFKKVFEPDHPVNVSGTLPK